MEAGRDDAATTRRPASELYVGGPPEPSEDAPRAAAGGVRDDAPRVSISDDDPATLAHRALILSAVRPEEAVRLATAAEMAAVASGDCATASTALRARGVAAFQLRRLDEAVDALKGAVAAARKAGDDQLQGEALMSLASARVLRGDRREGMAAIERALTLVTGPARGRALAQRAAIEVELGRYDAAAEDIRTALPILRRAGDVQWLVRSLSNRSLVLTARRQFAAAESDLVKALELCDESALTLPAAYAEQNLGCLQASRGDVPGALRRFDAAELRYQELGLEVGSLLVDRAKVLLSVRLLEEARRAAEGAVRVFDRQHRPLHVPEAQLIVSTVALLQGDLATASETATSASATFQRQRRSEMLALARFARLQAQAEAVLGHPPADAVAAASSGPPEPSTTADTPSTPGSVSTSGPSVTPSRLRHAAEDLERAGWVVPALEARVLAGRIALAQGRPGQARKELSVAAQARRSGPAEARARAWLGEALLREAEGSRAGAKSALRAGLRVVEEYRETIGPSELRAHISVHRGELARTGLRMALEDRNPRAVHWWGERGRASAEQSRPALPTTDPELRHQLADLRTTVVEIDEARGQGTSTASLVARQVRLERRIRDYMRGLDDGSPHQAMPVPTVHELAERLGDVALVEYVEHEDVMHAVSIVDGRASLRTLGPIDQVRRSLSHLAFALHRLAHPVRAGTQANAGQVLIHVAQTLHSTLIEPVEHLVGDRPLLLVPTGELQSVPWSVLPSCAGRPVGVSPSATLWYAATNRPLGGERLVAVAGPGLPGASAEASAVGALYPGSDVLTGDRATSGQVSAVLEGSRVAHIAAHGVLRSDNPLFSALLLDDGPYTVYDLGALARTPHHVVLAACNTALFHMTAGQEVLGLGAALLGQDTATLVAPVVPIPDVETEELMVTYHGLLRGGCSPAEALATAQQRHREESPAMAAAAAGFICVGASHRPETA